MTRKPYIESSICAPQSRGGYGCHAVIDNSLDKIYRALSWLSAAASAFVCSAGSPALGVVAELSSRHWFSARRYPPSIPRLYTLHPTLKQGLAQSDKGSLPLHFTPYARTRFSAKR